MSKSHSLNRSSSTENEHDPETGSIKQDPLASSILEEDNQNTTTTTNEGRDADVSTDNSTPMALPNHDPNDNNDEVMPASPPPSYEFVLEETRLKKQESDQSQSPTTPKTPEIIHKSSKEFYKAVAKQFGITCKMSDHCRCYDCQSHYFDCEYEQNEQEKTDGGLGAGTPVFLHEVMHGSACTIL